MGEPLLRRLCGDREIVLAAVLPVQSFDYGSPLPYATEPPWADCEMVLAAVQQDGRTLQYATEALRADREVVLAAVQQDGCALQYATEALRADREVVLLAVQPYPYVVQYAADCLLEDPTFATDAKRWHHLLKLTMLSGRSTVVAAQTNEG
eukprot:294318-Amphidinium_carterae.1